ncbi:MAG: hypothetical protein RIG82_06315 [Phycisphaeraceae bacterium]
MSNGNLIPKYRIELRRFRRRLQRWTSITIIALAGTAATVGVVWASQQQPEQGATLANLQSKLSKVNAQIITVRAEHARLHEQTASARIIRHHPNWGLLLDALAAVQGDLIVLRSLRLATPSEASPTEPLQQARIDLEGNASDTASVSDYAVRLEATGLFQRVMIDESRRLDPNDERVRFRILALMAERGGEQ